jgi:hypothetical protein
MDQKRRIFVSYSERKETKALPERFRELLGKLEYYTYFFRNTEERGGQIASTIREQIENANLFVLLIDSSYLTSGWCYLEYVLLQRRNLQLQKLARSKEDFFLTILDERADAFRNISEAEENRMIDRAREVVEQIFSNANHPQLSTLFPELSSPGELRDSVADWWRMVVKNTKAYFDVTAKNTEYEVMLIEGMSELRKYLVADFTPPDGRFARLITAAQDPWTPVEPALNAACALAAFSIRFDRFHEGGWGFSFGNLFDRDEDGNFFSHGRFDTNALILDAVTAFLPSAIAAEQHGTTFYPETPDSITSRFDYMDRKPQITRLASGLARPAQLSTKLPDFFLDLGEMCAFIKKNKSRSKRVVQRWQLRQSLSRLAGETDDILMFELLSRVAATPNDQSLLGPLRNFWAQNDYNVRGMELTLNEVSAAAREIKEKMTANIRTRLELVTSLFSVNKAGTPPEKRTTLVDFAPIAEAIEHERPLLCVMGEDVNSRTFRTWYSQSLLRLFRPLFLMRFAEGKELLTEWVSKWASARMPLDAANWADLLRLIDRNLKNNDSKETRMLCGRLFVVATLLLLVCLRLKKLGVTTQAISADALTTGKNGSNETNCLLWGRFVAARINSPLLLSMDSVGWAAVLLLTDEIAHLNARPNCRLESQLEPLTQAWGAAQNILDARRIVLGVSKDGNGRPRKLDESVHEELREKTQQGFSKWVQDAQQSIPDASKLMREWPTQLAASSFFHVGFTAHQSPLELRTDGAVLIGNLSVKRRRIRGWGPQPWVWVDQVAEADRGYNQLFMAPISDILDLHVPDLNRLRGLLGHHDSNLIDIVARSVVQDCYVLQQDGMRAVWQRMPFEDATNRTIESLAATPRQNPDDAPAQPPTQRGYAHLLRIRGSIPNEKVSRWVLRTAVSVPLGVARASKSASETLAIEFRWRFIDVTLAVDGGAINIDKEQTDTEPARTL